MKWFFSLWLVSSPNAACTEEESRNIFSSQLPVNYLDLFPYNIPSSLYQVYY